MENILKDNIGAKDLSNYERNEIKSLLRQQDSNIQTDLEQMWHMIDLVWDYYKCDNKNLNWENINKFYSHPVWLLNGLFIEKDDISMGHRETISDWVVNKRLITIIDYGGGFATLSRLISSKSSNANISIYEPFPSDFALKRAKEFQNIRFINKLDKTYDCLLSIDVLEHVDDPLMTFAQMIKSVRIDGYLLMVNTFFPMIKCHLPKHFHFRYTFDIFAKMMGLEVIGLLKGSLAVIYKRTVNKKLNWTKIRFLERVSKALFHLFKIIPQAPLRFIYKNIKYRNIKT